MDIFNDMIQEGKKYYIYGTGNFAVYCYEKIIEKFGRGIILGFIETNPKKDRCRGEKVFSLNQIDFLKENVAVVIGSRPYKNEMESNLSTMGVVRGNMVFLDMLHSLFAIVSEREKKRTSKICFWPPIETMNDDLISKISWFAPGKVDIIVWCEEKEIRAKFRENVAFVPIRDVELIFGEVDYIYLWNVESIFHGVLEYREKIRVVDPRYYLAIETNNYGRLYYTSLTESEKNVYKENSVKNFREMREKYKTYKRSNIFCTGPSLEEVYGRELKNDFNIICNSIVKDKEFLEGIQPNLITFADVNFYMSPSKYCEAFYKDLLDGFKLYDYYIAVLDFEVPLILHHFPTLKDRIIGMTIVSEGYVFPDEDHLYVKAYAANILTQFMLPIASTICDDIYIAGCTGRNPDENYFWKHNGRVQYLDLMQSVFDMYPSFFSFQKYEDYYDHHCRFVEDMIEYGERLGKKYASLTTSYIPALEKRMKK